jgi:hypothetical protein
MARRKENTTALRISVAGSDLSNILVANPTILDPEIVAVDWVNRQGESIDAVKYGSETFVRVRVRGVISCSILIVVHCEIWQQDYIEIKNISHPSETMHQDTMFSFVPQINWRNISQRADVSNIKVYAYLIHNVSYFEQLPQEILRQMAIRLRTSSDYRGFSALALFNHVVLAEMTSETIELSIKIVCPIDADLRSHFVVHCTSGNMSESGIKTMTNFNSQERSRSKAHKYVMIDGTVIEIWPFSEKNVWATKTETRNNLKGKMFHVELNYSEPSVPSDAQYEALANLYIEASDIEGCWPIFVPHIEVDRGIPDGHGDPTDFNYNKFYDILRSKNVPIDDIPHFDHNRYWGEQRYRTPWSNDLYSWPPILTGDPHKK